MFTFDYLKTEREMKWNELLKKMKKAGYVYLRDAKGSHEIWHHPEIKGSEETIAKHGSKEIGTGLAKKILKRAGLK
ncbi:putative RNA binding protein YcfA (HicA-like mRNA interferase family) [Pedobacter sp. CG_S7]|uniref:type II toxin-antitoxin system HicA family toxin n=1 Tax=Pedobacter sp. CG_S7 TaxID=3143930 RepID=UPI003393BD82